MTLLEILARAWTEWKGGMRVYQDTDGDLVASNGYGFRHVCGHAEIASDRATAIVTAEKWAAQRATNGAQATKQKGLTLIETLLVVAFTVVAILVGSCVMDPERVAQRAAEEAAEKKAVESKRQAELKPRKISEADGCEVWAFNPGQRWQYFTRCGSKTETKTTWDECRTVTSGKTSRTECTPHSATVTNEPKDAQ
ncbi:MAG: pilus assembly FimT family protein [Comamonas sp.]|uniref:pilus assembly FimT family protein n=1 Tax=Comamonas sp. TaxID=34028 RepID=UPI003D110865